MTEPTTEATNSPLYGLSCPHCGVGGPTHLDDESPLVIRAEYCDIFCMECEESWETGSDFREFYGQNVRRWDILASTLDRLHQLIAEQL